MVGVRPKLSPGVDWVGWLEVIENKPGVEVELDELVIWPKLNPVELIDGADCPNIAEEDVLVSPKLGVLEAGALERDWEKNPGVPEVVLVLLVCPKSPLDKVVLLPIPKFNPDELADCWPSENPLAPSAEDGTKD